MDGHHPFLDFLVTAVCLVIYSIVSLCPKDNLLAYSVYVSSVKKSIRPAFQKRHLSSRTNSLNSIELPPLYSDGTLSSITSRDLSSSCLNKFDCLNKRLNSYRTKTSILFSSPSSTLSDVENAFSSLAHSNESSTASDRKSLYILSLLRKVNPTFLLPPFHSWSKQGNVPSSKVDRRFLSLSDFVQCPEPDCSQTKINSFMNLQGSLANELKYDSVPSQKSPVVDNAFAELLEQKRRSVDVALEQAIPRNVEYYQKASVLNEAMRYTLLSEAKRLRPIFCILTCEALGGTEDACMPAAVAIEMIHAMSLIHDDLPSMDDDSLRRGKATNHIIFGEDISILAGDALLSAAYTHIAKHTKGVSPDRVLEIIALLGESAGIHGLAGGQSLDLQLEGATNATVEDVEWIHQHKTGSLLKVAVVTGAIIAGGTEEEINRVEQYADKIGLAFQVADDILDVTQPSEILGKTAGKDLMAKKLSYPRLLGTQKSLEIAARLIREAIKVLEPLKEKAIPLIKLAFYISSRNH